jgi:hypothetical protein
MKNDPIVAEVRKHRLEIEQKYGNNSVKLINHFKEVQEKYKDRLYTGKPRLIRTAKVA